MNYLLFVSFNTGLLHNAFYTTLEAVRESVEQLIDDDGATPEDGKLLSLCELKEHLNTHDNYTGYLSNSTWFHIQPQDTSVIVK